MATNPTIAPIVNIPITYDNTDEAGKYHPESFIHKIASSILPSMFKPGGSISVNPNNTADVNRVIKHESVHALLDPLVESGEMDKLNAQNPYFSKIPADQVGDKSTELPAYAATGEINMLPNANPILSGEYLNTLRQQLMQLDPKLGKAFQQLSQGQ